MILLKMVQHIKIPIHKKKAYFHYYYLKKKLRTVYEEEKPDIVHGDLECEKGINFYAFKGLQKTTTFDISQYRNTVCMSGNV